MSSFRYIKFIGLFIFFTILILFSDPVFSQEESQKYFYPVKNYTTNETKKVFGQYVSDRFTGYHVGSDIEVNEEDLEEDVAVYAITDGEVLFAGKVSGYGGVIILKHQIDGNIVTGIYGHIRLSDFKIEEGQTVKAGELLGYLGKANSEETDGERKHLHFGLHKGEEINFRGYVSSEDQLSDWLNPIEVLKNHSAVYKEKDVKKQKITKQNNTKEEFQNKVEEKGFWQRVASFFENVWSRFTGIFKK